MGALLVLWDIDGTLLDSGGVGRDLYGTVFVQLFERSLETFAPMAGRTDRSIILETLTMAGVPEPRRHVDPFIARMSAQVPLVRAAVSDRGQAMPGAAAALAALRSSAAARQVWPHHEPQAARAAGTFGTAGTLGSAGMAGAGTERAAEAIGTLVSEVPPRSIASFPAQPGGARPPADAKSGGPMAVGTTAGGMTAGGGTASGTPAGGTTPGGTTPGGVPASAAPARPERVHQSVLTGNIRPVAEAKLGALGLREPLDLCIGAYGDDHEVRTELVHVARRRAAAVHGRSPADFAGASTVVVGDTPLDIEAALAAGARAVGVATGAFSCADLTDAGAQAVLSDLTDTAAVLQALFA